MRARQVRADRVPAHAAVAVCEHDVGAEVQTALVEVIERERLGANDAIPFRRQRDRRDFLRLSGALDEALDFSAEEDARMQRIGNDVAVFLRAGGVPIALRDCAPIAAAAHARRTALLLAAADPIWKPVVGGNVVHLRRRLVVPGTPRAAVIDRNRRALIAHRAR